MFLALCALSSVLGQLPNLALKAKAAAFEFYDQYQPEKANDGKLDTRWSGIPGHNTGAWYQLDWSQPVQVGEVIVHQYDRFTVELDVQVWDSNRNAWVTKKHYGKPGLRLLDTVICRFDPISTTKVRIANCTNGPSFQEVEVYPEAFATYKPEVHAASDLQGNIVGVVTDPWGAEPVVGAKVDVVTVESIEKGNHPVAAANVRVGTVTADQNGMFSTALPVGPKGKIQLNVNGPFRRSKNSQEFDAADFQYGLTELGYKPKVTLLDGAWKFMGDPPAGFEKPSFDDSTWKDIKVPAHWEMEGFVVRSGHGGYRKKFTKPLGEGRLKIRFDGVYSGCDVYCNGTLVARHTGGATPFEADLTDLVHDGENVLAVDVQEHTIASDHLDKMSQYAYFHLSGIWRSAFLFWVPEVHFGRCEWSAEGKQGTLRVNLVNEGAKPWSGSVGADFPIADDQWKRSYTDIDNISIAPNSASKMLSLPVSCLKTWNAEQPNLFMLNLWWQRNRMSLKDGIISLRVGSRQTTISGTQILINNTPVKFKGTCHHDQDPLKGRAVSYEDEKRDLQLMKEANLNALRTSHYPPHPSLPEIADELGIYVEAEAPFCWADCSQDLRYAPLILQLTAETIQRDRNHPSVVWWSMANESEYGWGFWRALEWASRADPSRPHSAATSAQPGDEKGISNTGLDIYTLHNPIATDRIEDGDKRFKKPLIFDESFCIFQGIFGDVAEMWVDPGIRDYYIEPLKPIYEAFMKSPVTQGSFIWAWSDDIFCIPNRGLEYGRETTRSHFLESSYLVQGRGLVGDAPWGVVDGWRRKKPEFWHVKMLHAPLKATASLKPSADLKEFTIPIENQFDFTDLSDLDFFLEIGSIAAYAKAAGLPRQTSSVSFSNSQFQFGTQEVSAFAIYRGKRIDLLRIPPKPPELLPLSERRGPLPSKLIVESFGDLSGNSLRIRGDSFEVVISRETGLIRSCLFGGRSMILEFPCLHLLPSADARSPQPNQRTWSLKDLKVDESDKSVTVVIRGAYDGFTGQYKWTIAADGQIEVESEFTRTAEDFYVREAGLRFSVPESASLLQWRRNGEWPRYASNDINRLEGMVLPFPTRRQGGQSPFEWGWDYSPMGSAEYRSTKRNITWASIGYGADTFDPWYPWMRSELIKIAYPRIEVLSDGTQHLRAMVEPDRISVHVNDFYGGTNAGWWEWEHNYGKGKLIKKGDVLKSKLVLRLVGQ